MTDNETALHTVLGLLMKPTRPADGHVARIDELEMKLVEIQMIVEPRVVQNALDKVS